MFEALTRDLGRLAVFMICAQMIVLFRPRESYEKYLRLLMSALILLQFLTPVKRILTGEALDSQILENYAEALETSFDGGWDECPWDGKTELGGECPWDGKMELGGESGIEVEMEAVTEIKTKEINLGGGHEP